MKKITGIIAEFNPFHNGHHYLLNQAEGLKIIAMSGNWVQRGEPALFDKWTRTEMALRNGADLVIELPTLVSVQSADYFASGAVQILKQLGINSLTFGSESDTDYNKIAQLYSKKTEEMEAFVNALPERLSYPEKTQLMWSHFSPVNFDGDTPNHILALAYAKAVSGHQIKLEPIKRIGAFHSTSLENERLASATAIRKQMLSENDHLKIAPFIPENLIDLYQTPETTWNDFFPFLVYRVLSSDLSNIFQLNQELAHRIQEAIKKAQNIDELVELVHTKRYTKARVRRIFTYILLNISQEINLPEKIHVLGFSQEGQAHLRNLKAQTIVRIGQNPWDQTTQTADKIYQLGNPKTKEQNFGRKPIIQ